MVTVTLLHVSDVHFGTPDPNKEQRRITKALIEAAHGAAPRPDFCVFTGDLTFSGAPSEFETGGRWLAELLEPWNCPLFVVPGNHDIQRKFAQHEKLRPLYPSDESYNHLRAGLKKNHERFNAFRQWHDTAEKANLVLPTAWSGALYLSSASLPIKALSVHVICINTALLSCADDDMGKLVVDVASLNNALVDCVPETELVIVAGHHPVGDWLAPWNADLVRGILSQVSGAHLYLHGHVHAAHGETVNRTTGQGVTVLGAGAAYQGSEWRQEFAFYEIDCDAKQIQPHSYLYNHEMGAWQPDITLSQPVVALLPTLELEPPPGRVPAPSADAGEVAPKPEETDAAAAKPEATEAAAVVTPDSGNLELAARRLHSAALLTEKTLNSLLDAWVRSADICYSCKGRTKTVPDILDKVNRYRSMGKTGILIDQINDACGFRLVTYFQLGIAEAIEYILDLIGQRTGLPSPFIEDSLVEIEIYTSRPESDPLSVVPAVQHVVNDSGLPVNVKVKAKSSGYSSVHIVARCGVRSADPALPRCIGVEFQVRSAFEEVWGEIEHKLRYRSSADTSGETSWHYHLNALKALVDGCIQYTDVIKRQAEEARPPPPPPGEGSKSATTSSMVLARLQGIPNTLYAELESVYLIWQKAEDKKGGPDAPALYHKAADAFRTLLDHAAEFIASDRHLAVELHYWIRMELAYCLLQTGDQSDLQIAEQAYRAIEEEFKDDAASRFRHGLVLRHLRRYDDAASKYREAIDILQNNRDERIDDDHWVRSAVWRNLGYIYGKMSTLHSHTPDGWRAQLSNLHDAINCTQNAHRNPADPEDHLRTVNNLIYYGWSEREVPLKDAKLALHQSTYEASIAELWDELDVSTSTNDLHLDTLCRGLWSLKDPDNLAKAKTVAGRILEVMKERIVNRSEIDPSVFTTVSDDWAMERATKYLDVEELDTFLFALAIFRSS